MFSIRYPVETEEVDFRFDRLNQAQAVPVVKVDATPSPRRDVSPSRSHRHEEKLEAEEKKGEAIAANHGSYGIHGTHGTQESHGNHTDDEDAAQIIPWRAQLRKTNSKLNILD